MKDTFTLTSKYRNQLLTQVLLSSKMVDEDTEGGIKAIDYLPLFTSVCIDEEGSTISLDGYMKFGKALLREVTMDDVNYRSNMTFQHKTLTKKALKKLTDRINATLETI